MQYITKVNIKGKRVLIRTDFNVPIQNGKITDDTRIRASIPTIEYCIKKGAAQIILMSHRGRPKSIDPEFSLKPISKRLSKLLKTPVVQLNSCSYIEYEANYKAKDCQIIVLENLRFHPEEKKNDTKFAKELAKFADIYVNDAFGTAHRKHASNHAITKLLPSYGGLLLQKEIAVLSSIFNPKRPLVSIVGFAKISDKLPTLKQLLKQSDYVLFGGAVVFTFLRAQGIQTGKSLVEEEQIETAKKLLKQFKNKIILPKDVICATSLSSPKAQEFDIHHIPNDMAGFDIGFETVTEFESYLTKAKTIFWNGPVGVFEQKPYNWGTKKIASMLAKSNAITIIGGGDTVSAILQTKMASSMTHLSTGGGAALEFISGSKLPAIAQLEKR